MNRALAVLAASAFLASGAALACNDMKMSDDGDGGVIASRAPVTPVASAEKATEPPLVVKQKQPVAKKTSAGKPLPQGAVLSRTGS